MKELFFKFKGSRDYIQGPDVYDQLLPFFKDKSYTNFDLSFHQIMKHNIILSKTQPEDDKELYFVCKFEDEDRQKQIYGIKNPNSKPSESIAYPEENIIQKARLDTENKCISLDCPTDFSLMEEIIALNKYLLQETIQKQKQGKWYFARLHLPAIPIKREYPLSICLKANFNFLLTKSEILFNNQPLAGGGALLFFGSKKKV